MRRKFLTSDIICDKLYAELKYLKTSKFTLVFFYLFLWLGNPTLLNLHW
jgi:hypothetical protein